MMVCPACRSEYRDGFTHCADCFAELVVGDPSSPEPQPVPEPEKVDLVSVFETGNPSLVLLAKSLLESANIEFVTRGEGLQDLLGLGRFPAQVNLISGPVVFEVKHADAADALALLADLKSDTESSSEDDASSDDAG